MSAGRNTTTRDRHRAAIARTKPGCGICGQAIDYTLKSPDPMSYEVDHIVAVVNGGADTIENKQASHRRCNRDKWHRPSKTNRPRVTSLTTTREW